MVNEGDVDREDLAFQRVLVDILENASALQNVLTDLADVVDAKGGCFDNEMGGAQETVNADSAQHPTKLLRSAAISMALNPFVPPALASRMPRCQRRFTWWV
ncbi:hypothetical protein RvY_01894 [Ramazzottius varieornatus]|uniref:Uncharacterized protein n=1 Tax=Ramazzottius varieornatus TaxID=947166 RepID=A0A1D1ULQ5_RAMVA|nr:hypothetical protein RvY_01894 [Ramazzottius varieornatus]